MSISSSDPQAGFRPRAVSAPQAELQAWRRFITVLLAVTAAIVVSAFAFVAIVDPYDSLAFSPPWKRYRITTNERYLATKARRGAHTLDLPLSAG